MDERYHKLLIISTYKGNRNTMAVCQCDCGNLTTVFLHNVKNGNTKSCGCMKANVIKHGLYKHKLYGVWLSMRARCRNPKDQEYHNYGARGIKVCDEWQSAETFITWSIDNGWAKGMSIERNDVNGNYCPENCRYIPLKQQNKNLRKSVRLHYKGEAYIIADLAKEVNIHVSTLRNRLKAGMSIDDAVSIAPSRNNPKFKKMMQLNGL